MKIYSKLVISSLFLAFSLTVSAQLKVFSDGHISALSSFTQAKSPISINCLGDTSYLITAKVENKRVLSCEVTNTENYLRYAGCFKALATSSTLTNNSAVGVRADASSTSAIGLKRAYGIMGCSNSAKYSIGVFGMAGSTYERGAAIFGTTSSNYGTIIPSGEMYAGFFHGNVMITGNLTLNGSLNGLILGQSSNASLPGAEEPNNERASISVLDKLAGLQTTVFQKAEPSYYSTKESTVVDEEFGEEVAPKPTFIEEQYYNKNHYALSAEQLEKVFPELVYEQEDGSKAINYVEMIPLLVQTINELQGRLASLERVESPMERVAANDATSVESAAPVVVAKLAQNTPNPFTERTTIRFTLPEDVQNAYIYIFDMTGKMQKQLPVDASMQSITINGYELSAGMYIYSLVVNGKEMDTKRMILSK